MIVGIDASSALVAERSGVGNYTGQLIAGLRRIAASDHDNPSFVYFSNRFDVSPAENVAGVGPQSVYPGNRLPSRLLWTQFGVPQSIRRSRPDVCHFPNYLAPLLSVSPSKLVVTMHDMSIYRCPEHHTRKTVSVHRALIPAIARLSSRIIAPSHSAAADILECLRVPEERVRVVYSGIDPSYHPEEVVSAADRAVRDGYNLRRPYILTVGTLEPRKNHIGLIDAFGRLLNDVEVSCDLVIAGTRGWKDRRLLERCRHPQLLGRVHLLGYVPSAHLPALYRGASLFAFPSLYEGFGLPVLEALACGTPTLVSHDPALLEVAGTANVISVRANDVDDIAAGILQGLGDQALRWRLRRNGLLRAADFTWERCARETLEVYREAVGESVAVSGLVAAS